MTMGKVARNITPLCNGIGSHSKVEFYQTMEVYFTLQWDWGPILKWSFVQTWIFSVIQNGHFELNCCLNNATILLHFTIGLDPHSKVDSTLQWIGPPLHSGLCFGNCTFTRQ